MPTFLFLCHLVTPNSCYIVLFTVLDIFSIYNLKIWEADHNQHYNHLQPHKNWAVFLKGKSSHFLNLTFLQYFSRWICRFKVIKVSGCFKNPTSRSPIIKTAPFPWVTLTFLSDPFHYRSVVDLLIVSVCHITGCVSSDSLQLYHLLSIWPRSDAAASVLSTLDMSTKFVASSDITKIASITF